MTECPHCNYRNPMGAANCMTCGRGIQQGPRRNPSSVYPVGYYNQTPLKRSKMAVFDIDDTIFDTSQREANARRAGLAPSTPYTGDRKPSEYPKGKQAFLDFFNSPKQFRIDPPIPGAIDFVRGLANNGYVICYLTGRPKQYHDATVEHLRENGLPLFRRENGEILLYMKPNHKAKTSNFKFDTMRDLQSEYEISYFFDDLAENREMAFRLGVVGVYHLPDRLGIKQNPSISDFFAEMKEEEEERKRIAGGGSYTDASSYKWRGNPNHIPEGYREAAGCIVQRSDGKVLLLRRSVLETSKHGMYELPGGKLEEGETPSEAAIIETKEEAGLDVKLKQALAPHVDHNMRKVYHGFVAVPKKNAKVVISEEHDEYKWVTINEALALPDNKLSHHARFLFHQMQGEAPLPNPLPKPRKKKGRREPSKTYVKRMMGDKKMRAEFPDSGQRYAVTLRLVEMHYGKAARKRIAPRPNGLFSRAKIDRAIGQDSNGMNFESSKNRSFLANSNVYEEYPPSTIISDNKVEIRYRGEHPSWIEVDTGSGPQRYQGPILEFTLDRKSGHIEAKQGSISKQEVMSKSEKQQHLAALGERPSPVDDPQGFKRHLEQSIRISQGLRNPAPSKKVNKAKEAYKKFHGGKAPKDIKTETIDVGDVWYGLGPCWSIGYMSPKETGDDGQKYIHHTNEDSKDGNYPMMYATMPENGEPMIVIKGGSMKIGMRDGLAWLID